MSRWLRIKYAHNGVSPDTGPDGTVPPVVDPILTSSLVTAVYAWSGSTFTDITGVMTDEDPSTTFAPDIGPDFILFGPNYGIYVQLNLAGIPAGYNGELRVGFEVSPADWGTDWHDPTFNTNSWEPWYHLGTDPIDSPSTILDGQHVWSAGPDTYYSGVGTRAVVRTLVTDGVPFGVSAGTPPALAIGHSVGFVTAWTCLGVSAELVAGDGSSYAPSVP